MPTEVKPGSELKAVEEAAAQHLDAGAGHLEADIDLVADAAVELEELPAGPSPVRPAIAVALTTVAAAIMVGGVFQGISPRFYATVAGLLGVGLAVLVLRLRRPALSNAAVVIGLFAIGLLMVLPAGIDSVANLRALVGHAAATSKALRPPAPFTAGWAAILGWIMGTIGFAAAWVATAIRRPSLGVLLPLPVAAIAAISIIARDAQIISGLLVLVLFAAALGVLSGSQIGGGEEGLPRGYELRRAAKAVPIIAVITGALYLLTLTNFLFPHPLVDPSLEPQKPKAIPLGQVQDRVLFEVGDTQLTGPWVMGHLDVYDGLDWRLPPFKETSASVVPRSGIVDSDLKPATKATITVRGLDGAVLPDIANTVGIVEEGPQVTFDKRSGSLRLVEGQVQSGFSYTVVGAAIPDVGALKALGTEIRFPAEARKFASVPAPPQAVKELIAKAPGTSRWEQFDYLRTYILTNVTAVGTGTPVSVSPQRVQEMLTGKKEGSPFEIVAAEALVARWVGVPSRIGYGFDGGETVNGKLEVHPKNGIAFPEVYFPGYKWLPVIGTPVHARVTVGGTSNVQQNIAALPSDNISVPVYLPLVAAGQVPLYETVRQVVLVVLPIALLLVALYFTYPVVVKAIRRARRRAQANAAGPRAQVALAYAEWRDYCTDFGYQFATDTPLMFLDRFIHDPEHTQLAWLVTRALWGDLRVSCSSEMASDAQELSRNLRRRLAQAQPITVRTVALVSRLSLRNPYDPEGASPVKNLEVVQDAA
ncbi:MAG: DUF3488 and transglutaminase-like domain-containing protein [Candidatus Dormibacteria bacterium]